MPRPVSGGSVSHAIGNREAALPQACARAASGARAARRRRRAVVAMRVWLAAAAAAAGSGLAPDIGMAATPPRVSGESCARLGAEIGRGNVWQTSFVGQRRGFFDRLESFHAAPCFRTQAACKAWLYWAQTDWNYYQYFNPCRKGIR